MDAYIGRYLTRVEGLKAAGTYQTRLSDLRNFNEWVEAEGYEDVTALGVLDLEEYFINQAGQDYAPSTLTGRYESVRGLYEFLTDKLGEYENTPFDNMTRSDYVDGTRSRKFEEGDIVYVTPEEKDLLVENVPNPTLRNELLIRLLWQTGMRRGEVVSVDVDDVDRDERGVRVYSTKTGKSRTVFWQPSLDFLMDQWIDGGYRSSYPAADRTSRLFVTRQGELKEDRLGYIVREAADNAGIQETLYIDANGHERRRITTHALRHGHGVHALKSGIDVRTVQRHLGHEKLEMTMRYLQLIDSDVKEGYRRFGMEKEGPSSTQLLVS